MSESQNPDIKEKKELPYWQRLKELRALRDSTVKHWEGKHQEMEQERKESLQEAFSANMKQMKTLNEIKSEEKRKAKGQYTQQVQEAEKEQQLSIKKAAELFKMQEGTFAKEMDTLYEAANTAMQTAAAPINAQYTAALQSIEEDFKKEIHDIKEVSERDLQKLEAAVVELETKENTRIEAERQKSSEAAKVRAEAIKNSTAAEAPAA